MASEDRSTHLECDEDIQEDNIEENVQANVEQIVEKDNDSSASDEPEQENRVSYIGANEVKVGSYVLLKGVGFPCKIVETNWSKPGKHGSAKISFVGLDIFTRKKHVMVFGAHEVVPVPEVLKQELEAVSLTSNTVQLRTKEGKTKSMPVPLDEIREKLAKMIASNQGSVLVQIQTALNKDQIVGVREKKRR